MANPPTLVRHYKTPDATMRQDMRTMQQHFVDNQKAFAAFNPEFAAPFDKTWASALDAADQAAPVAERRGALRQDTAAVGAVMEQARAAVQQVFYFVGRAYPGNAGRLEQYGRRQYEKARADHDRMRALLALAFASATRDQKDLAAKGYGKTQLGTLGTLAAELAATNTTQETTKGTNVEGTADYLTRQNLAYGYGQEVSAAAAVLFASDAAKLGLFRLGGGAASRPAGQEHHEVTVHPGRRKALRFTGAFDAASRLRLHLGASQPGQAASVGRVVAPADTPAAPLPLAHGQPDPEVLAAALGAAGQYLVVQNTGTGTVRVEATLM